MRRALVLAPFVAIATLATACEKGRGVTASGPLDPADKAMFRYLPARSSMVLGGNFLALKNFLRESLNKGWTPGTAEWESCLATLEGMKLAGAVSLGTAPTIRILISGPTLDDISGCGQKAGFKTAFDADHNSLTVEQTLALGAIGKEVFLVVPGGALYTRFPLTEAQAVSASRADLERDIAELKDTVADDATLKPFIEGLDRSKTGWFVIRGGDTQLADIMSNVWGTFDLSPAKFAVDFTLQLKDEKDAEQFVRDYDRVRSSASGEEKALIDTFELKRRGSELHVTGRVTGDQIHALSTKFSAFMPSAN